MCPITTATMKGTRIRSCCFVAAINLARWEEPSTAVGPVRAAVKRGADRKTRPSRAGGCEARKGRSRKAAEQPRNGVQVA